MLEDQGRKTTIQELVDKLRTVYQTASIVTDLGKKRKFKKFSEESRDTFRKLGKIELYELGEISETVQCQECLKNALEELIYCPCGVCLMPSPEEKRQINTQCEIMTIPFYTVSEDDSRGANLGGAQWQHIHWKARDARKGARKQDHKSVTLRWQKDAKYRAAQTVHGCREEQ